MPVLWDLGRERRRFEREAARAELLHPGVERRVARIGVWLLMARDVRIFAPELERFGLAIGVVLACEPGAIAARSGDVVQILRVEGVVCGKAHPHPMRTGPAPGEHPAECGDGQRRGSIRDGCR